MSMNIIEALKSDKDLRITNRYRWMVWDNIDGCWRIYYRGPRSKKTKIIYSTVYENMGIEVLINGL